MISALKRFLNQGAIRISREKERAIYFYATVALLVLYLLQWVQGSG